MSAEPGHLLLIALEGLAHAVRMIASEHPKLAGSEPGTAALAEVMLVLLEKHEQIKDVRIREYRARLSLRKEVANG